MLAFTGGAAIFVHTDVRAHSKMHNTARMNSKLTQIFTLIFPLHIVNSQTIIMGRQKIKHKPIFACIRRSETNGK